MAALYALKAVKDSGRRLNKKIRLIVGTDEQRYYRDMQYYLSQERPPITGFTLDGQFPVVLRKRGWLWWSFPAPCPRRERNISAVSREALWRTRSPATAGPIW